MNTYLMRKSYIDAIAELDPDDQLDMFWAIADYAMSGDDPGFKDTLRAVFAAVRSQIDYDKQRYAEVRKNRKNAAR